MPSPSPPPTTPIRRPFCHLPCLLSPPLPPLLLPRPPIFTRVTRFLCSHKDLCFDSVLGVLLDAKHGVAFRLTASVNYFTLYALSNNKVWVFTVKDDIGDDNDNDNGSGGGLRLIRCTVIECARPVFSLSVTFGFLILREENEVRVFGLRRLVKGKSGNNRFGNSKQLRNRGGSRKGFGGGQLQW